MANQGPGALYHDKIMHDSKRVILFTALSRCDSWFLGVLSDF
jgi:hypothetical protein